MAGRNKRKSADYFSHDADASSDEKLVYLESMFGHTGYALYFKFLEKMTRAEGFRLEWNDIKKAVYASEFRISVTEIDRFISECCRKEIKAFILDDSTLFSPGLIARFQPLLDKREYNRLKYEKKKLKDSSSIENSVTEKANSVTEATQYSKVKERKGKNKRIADSNESATPSPIFYKTKKGKKLSGKRLITFNTFWEIFNFKYGKTAAADSWLEIDTLTDQITQQIFTAAKIEASRREEILAKGSTPKWAQGWISDRRWEDEAYQPVKESKPTRAIS